MRTPTENPELKSVYGLCCGASEATRRTLAWKKVTTLLAIQVSLGQRQGRTGSQDSPCEQFLPRFSPEEPVPGLTRAHRRHGDLHCLETGAPALWPPRHQGFHFFKHQKRDLGLLTRLFHTLSHPCLETMSSWIQIFCHRSWMPRETLQREERMWTFYDCHWRVQETESPSPDRVSEVLWGSILCAVSGNQRRGSMWLWQGRSPKGPFGWESPVALALFKVRPLFPWDGKPGTH